MLIGFNTKADATEPTLWINPDHIAAIFPAQPTSEWASKHPWVIVHIAGGPTLHVPGTLTDVLARLGGRT